MGLDIHTLRQLQECGDPEKVPDSVEGGLGAEVRRALPEPREERGRIVDISRALLLRDHIRGRGEKVTMERAQGWDLAAELAAGQLVQTLVQMLGTDANVDAVTRRFPAEPPPGTVIRFEREFEDEVPTVVYRGDRAERIVARTYTYVAFRSDRKKDPWFITGIRGREAVSWPRLADMIGGAAPCEIATRWADVPPLPEPEQEGPRDAAEYVAKHFRAPPVPAENTLGWKPQDDAGTSGDVHAVAVIGQDSTRSNDDHWLVRGADGAEWWATGPEVRALGLAVTQPSDLPDGRYSGADAPIGDVR